MNDHTRFRLRQATVSAHAMQSVYSKGLAKLAKEDPGVAKVIAVADKEFKQWTTLSPRRFKLLGLVAEMEKAGEAKRRSAFAGCEEKTGAAWREELSALKLPALPEKNSLGVYAAATQSTAEGYLAYTALRLCAMAQVTDVRQRQEAASWTMQTRRGPFSSTLTQWGLIDKIEFDAQDLSYDKMRFDAHAFVANAPTDGFSSGVIASVKDAENGEVTVTFKTVKEKRFGCMEWASTNRVDRVNSSGIVEYQQRCVRKGSGFMDLTPRDVSFGKAMAQGLKPGMYLVAMDGLPVVATAEKGSKKPVFVLGGMLR